MRTGIVNAPCEEFVLTMSDADVVPTGSPVRSATTVTATLSRAEIVPDVGDAESAADWS
ncbi:MAG TPA: hypothetical protein VLA36_02540 [Longimicrobiales bacterium]|nr:hypothetical protein [Longimicrobiales bacterium]